MMLGRLAGACIALSIATCAAAQLRDNGLPPPSGEQNPVLSPPSGRQNPVLPPPSGSRYPIGQEGRWKTDEPWRSDRGRETREKPGSAAPRDFGRPYGTIAGDVPATKPGSIGTYQDVTNALRACWTPPPTDNPQSGAQTTLRFSFRRDGTLIGEPRVTASSKAAERVEQAAFSRSTVEAVKSCTPLAFTPALAAVIPGRIFTMRFVRSGRLYPGTI